MKTQFYQKVNLKSKKEMTDFLRNHFRYDTMNSWNKSTSYANKVKIYSVIPLELQNKVFELMEAEEFYYPLNNLILDWDNEQNYYFQAGFNGRSGGYVVMYEGGKRDNGQVFSYPGRSIDMNEDFEDWDIESLKERVKLVQSFDKLCDNIVNEVIYMAENNNVEEEEFTVIKKRKIIV